VNSSSLAAAAAPYRRSFCWIADIFAVIGMPPWLVSTINRPSEL
jgi:hypothetical protein